MTTINLKEFYPWYTHDEYIEVSEGSGRGTPHQQAA